MQTKLSNLLAGGNIDISSHGRDDFYGLACRNFRFHEYLSILTLFSHTVRTSPRLSFSSTKNKFCVISIFPTRDFRVLNNQVWVGKMDGFHCQTTLCSIPRQTGWRMVMLFKGRPLRFGKDLVCWRKSGKPEDRKFVPPQTKMSSQLRGHNSHV